MSVQLSFVSQRESRSYFFIQGIHTYHPLYWSRYQQNMWMHQLFHRETQWVLSILWINSIPLWQSKNWKNKSEWKKTICKINPMDTIDLHTNFMHHNTFCSKRSTHIILCIDPDTNKTCECNNCFKRRPNGCYQFFESIPYLYDSPRTEK